MNLRWLAEAERSILTARRGRMGRVLKFLNGSRVWRLISTAPFNQEVELHVTDLDQSYFVPFPCHQTNKGWINSDLGVLMRIEPTQWRPWRRSSSEAWRQCGSARVRNRLVLSS